MIFGMAVPRIVRSSCGQLTLKTRRAGNLTRATRNMARYTAVMIIMTFANGGYSSSSASPLTAGRAAFSTSPATGSFTGFEPILICLCRAMACGYVKSGLGESSRRVCFPCRAPVDGGSKERFILARIDLELM